ncbi:hypothetical protein COL5a_002846 [Colletotrichum fioriniae]|nr:hypothetical protein COL5a_002846 [Colletotrichum fioriniae]
MSGQRTGSSHQAKRPRLGERTMLACIGCKQKKLKCDGQSPKCQNCVRTGRDCLVEDPGTGLHRPRDYMKSLEARVAYLEGLLQQARPEVALDHFGANNEGGGRDRGREVDQHASATAASHNGGPTQPMSIMHMPSALAPNLQAHHSSFEDVDFSRALRAPSVDADDHHVDTLSSEVALLCLSAAGREPHYFGPSSAVSFSRIVSATMGLASTGGSSQHSHAGRGKDINPEVVREVPLRLPSPTLRANLSEAYFNNIHPQYPFLHKPTFQIWEETCLKASLDGDLSSVNGSTLFFVLMIYSIGSLVLGQSHYDAAEVAQSVFLTTLSMLRAHPLSVFTSRSWFQLAYDHSILLLYRHYMMGGLPANHPTPDGTGGGGHGATLNDNEATERVLEECAVRAREMCMLYRRVYQSSSVQFTWGSLHILFLGGLTYLYCLWRSKRVRDSTRQADVVTTCMACTTVLIIIAERWNLATSYRDIFEALSQRTISMICNDGQKPAAAAAPGGVNNTSLPAIGPGPGAEADMHAAFGGGAAPSMQDWIMGLDDLSIPQESEWLVQELLQGVRDY